MTYGNLGMIIVMGGRDACMIQDAWAPKNV